MPGSTNVSRAPTANSTVPVAPTAPNVGGAGSLWQALADSSDSTYLTAGGWGVVFGATGVGDLDYVQNVSFSVRFEQTSVAKTTRTMVLYDPVTNKGVNWSYIVTEASPTTHTSPLFTSIGGTKLTRAVVDRLVLYGLFDTGLRMYQARLIINYNQPAVVSAISPAGVIGNSSPVFTWVYTDPEGDPQEAVDVVVHTAATMAQYGMTTAPTHLELAQFVVHAFPTSASLFTSDALRLPPGNYRVWIRAFDQGSHGRVAAWGFADISVVIARPATPQVLVTTPYSEQFGRLGLTVQGFDNLLTEDQASAEGTTADYAVTNASVTLDPTTAGTWDRPDGPVMSTKSLRIQLTSTATATAQTPATLATGRPVVAGQSYIGGAHVISPVNRVAFASIVWVNAANATISTSSGPKVPTTAQSQPSPVFVVATAPAGAVRAVVKISIVNSLNTEAHYFDDWFLAPSLPGPLRDSALWNMNLVANTSFETYSGGLGHLDWNRVSSGGSQSVAAFADHADAAGAQCMQILKTETVLAPPYAEWPDVSTRASPDLQLPVVAGDVLVVVGRQKVIAGAGVTVEAVYQDATHHEATCAAFGAGWEPFVFVVQIPSGKTAVSFRFLPVAVGANGSAGTVRIDEVNVWFANPATVTAFHALGGASGTPKAAGVATIPQTAFTLATPPMLYFPWTRGGFTDDLAYLVERSADAGVTWSTVHALPNFGADLAIVGYDYEATPNARLLYRASSIFTDPFTGDVFVSPVTTPALPDPGFEEQQWTNLGTDPYGAQFQPPDGAWVGTIRPSSGAIQSQPAPIPAWAASIGVKLLARSINCALPGAQLFTPFYDDVGNAVSSPNPMVLRTVGLGDSGWQWFETDTLVPVPANASSVGIVIGDPGAFDPATPNLFLIDTVIVWIAGADGLSNSAETPSCVQWLKDPENPGANLQIHADVVNLGGSGNTQATGHESVSTEPQLVIQPSGRSTPLILADVPSAETFGILQLTLKNDAEWRAFETLRKSQRTLLLQLPYGDLTGEQHYVRLGDVRVVGRVQTQDQAQHQRRRVQIAAREVDAP